MDRSLCTNKVTQANALVSAHYALSLRAKRLLVAALSQIDPFGKSWLKGEIDVTVTAQQWSELFGTDINSSYRDLRAGAADLYGRSVRLYGDHLDGKNIRWISSEEYSQSEGRITITFVGRVLYHLSGMIEEFTSYDLLGVAGLRSAHSIRVYELAQQFKSTGWRKIDLVDLRSMLGLSDAYPKFADFRRRVLDHCCHEITRKSDIDLSWEPVKRGRTVVAIVLRVSAKSQIPLF
jgi:plasmid replication initiation protein|tara:strand:+ start:208 stop:912 length:705 start_codon:yes stop_codon:yes gene_type:complete